MNEPETSTTRVLPTVDPTPTRERMVWDGTDAGTAPLPDDAAPAPAPAPTVAAADAAPVPARPRIRWAAVLWGAVLAVAGGGTLVPLLDAGHRDAFASWIDEVSPGLLGMYGVLVAGGIVLLIGLLGLIRGAERRRAAVEGAGS